MRIDRACPHCGGEPGNYFEFSEDWEWKVTKGYEHPAGDDPEAYACRDGCEQWTEGHFWFDCEHCDGEIEAHCTYVQPCDANGYVVEMVWGKSTYAPA